MISGKTIDATGGPIKVRLCARAMRALEDVFEVPIFDVPEKLQEDPSIKTLIKFFREVVNDGEGGEDADGAAVIDATNYVDALKLFEDLFDGAFPGAKEAGAEAAGKNPKRAPKRK